MCSTAKWWLKIAPTPKRKDLIYNVVKFQILKLQNKKFDYLYLVSSVLWISREFLRVFRKLT